MEINLNEQDIEKISEIVASKLEKKLLNNIVNNANYEAMVQAGKDIAIRMYGDLGQNNGVWEVLEKKINILSKERIDFVIRSQLFEMYKDESGLEKRMFEILLDGIVEKAHKIRNKIEYRCDDE